MNEKETIPCEICGAPTQMFGTKRCDPCWEIESRINYDSERFQKVLNYLAAERLQPSNVNVMKIVLAKTEAF